MIEEAVSKETKASYQRVWTRYTDFCKAYSLVSGLPIAEENFLRFISFLYKQGYASKTIDSMVSALSYYHKINAMDCASQSELVKRDLAGIRNILPSNDSRLPISKCMLNKLLAEADNIVSDTFTLALFKAMASLSFYGLLRVGEMTFSRNTLKIESIHVTEQEIHITFSNFKHSHGKSCRNTILATNIKGLCPVELLRNYLSVRGNQTGFLFMKGNGKAMSRIEFLALLKEILEYCGFDSKLFNTHSFRIGRATEMVKEGYSLEQIRMAGRWSSDAFKTYIRVNNLYG